MLAARLFPATGRPHSVRLVAVPLGLLVVSLLVSPGSERVRGESLPNPVAQFRTVLATPVNPPPRRLGFDEKEDRKETPDPEREAQLAQRKAVLARLTRDLVSPADMGRILLLDKWGIDPGDDALMAVDRQAREAVAERFFRATQSMLQHGDAPRQMAAANLIRDMDQEVRAPAATTSLQREREDRDTRARREELRSKYGDVGSLLANFEPHLLDLIQRAENPEVADAAAQALGNLPIAPTQICRDLEPLLSLEQPAAVRRAAAVALLNLSRVVAPSESMWERTGQALDLANSAPLLSLASLGLSPQQPEEVRRLCLETILQTGRAYERESLIIQVRSPVSERMQNILQRQVPLLVQASLDPNPRIRVQARQILKSLALLRTPPAERVPPPGPGDRRTEVSPSERPSTIPVVRFGTRPRPVQAALPRSAVIYRSASFRAVEEAPVPRLQPGLSLFAGLDNNQQVELTRTWLTDPIFAARKEAVNTLEAMGPDAASAIPVLVELGLTDYSLFVRWGAVRTLGRLAPRGAELAVPKLAGLLADSDLSVRIAVATTLSHYGPDAAAAVPALAEAFVRWGDSAFRIAVLHALESIGTDAAGALPTIARALNRYPNRCRPLPVGVIPGDEDPKIRRIAADVIGQFGPRAADVPGIVAALRIGLADPDPAVRQAASDALLRVLPR